MTAFLRHFHALFLLALSASSIFGCSRTADVASMPDPSPDIAHRSSALVINGGFEAGDLSGWTLQTYTNFGIGVFPPRSVADLSLRAGGNPLTFARNGPTGTQVPAGLTSSSTMRYPKYGNWSGVINELGSGRNVNLLWQSFQTTSADVDPSDGNIHIRFTIAPVLQNPGHANASQPYFYVVATNVTKNQVMYANFNFANELGVPWQADVNGVLYTDWQIVDVAPGTAGLAIGDTVRVDVYGAGCALGGHFGHVYVDAFGASLPGLGISGSGPQSANAGSNITYTYSVTNGGTAASTNVSLSSVLPANTTFFSMSVPGSVTCTTPPVGSSGTVSCNLGTVNPSANVLLSLTVNITPGTTGTINHGNYTIRGTGEAPLIGPLIVTNVTSGVTYADLSITKTDGVAAITWGQLNQYTIVVSNAGPNNVAGATVADTIPAQLTSASWTCTPGVGANCGAASGVGNIATTVDLNSGASATFQLNVRVIAGSGTSSVTNTASISPPAGVTDPDNRNNTAADVDAIGTLDTLTVTKGVTWPGTLISSPTAINCPPGCGSASGTFLDGSMVSLSAIAATGGAFMGWTGGCSGSVSPCNLTLTGNTSVGALFGYVVNGSASGGNGTLVCASPVLPGTNSICTLSPNVGYTLDALTDNAVDVFGSVSGNTYTVINVVAAHTVVATFKKDLGVTCAAGSECHSSRCVDGVCCNAACNGQCQACDVAGSAGTCSPVRGAPHGFRGACTSDGSACGGSCDGTNPNICAFPGAGTQCRAASCSAATATLSANCNGSGNCPAVQTQPCTPYICGPMACLGNCGSDADCVAGDYCSAGVCVTKLSNGLVCSAPNQCASNFCVDGVCCDAACNGQCQACDVGGSIGTCSNVTGGPHGGRALCTSDGTACAGSCGGLLPNSCAYPDSATQCRSASCSSGTATLPASCQSTGSCPVVQTQSCAPYICGATACLGNCSGDGDCASIDYCSAGRCVPKLSNGITCSTANQCTSNFCVDSVCCNQGCNGQCQACDVGGSLGTCTNATGAPHGGRTLCSTDSTACGGACDGATPFTCTYPGPGTQCRAPSCAVGLATLPASCQGTGACPAVQTQSCSPYVCGTTACLGNCSVSGDCVSGEYCSGGVCVPQLSNGASCSLAGQCSSGLCIDHYCCNAACGGECQACDVTGSQGNCVAVIGPPHGGRTPCTTDGTNCAGTCNGTATAVCTYPSASTQCRVQSCTIGTATLGASCGGTGSCPAIQTRQCSPYICGPNACGTNCVSDVQCSAGNYCLSGACIPKRTNGNTCTAENQCGSGFCIDGRCCNATCNGQCQACDVAGSVGTCAPVRGAPHGTRRACSSDGTMCGGTCNGTLALACAYPSGDTRCRTASCTNGTAILAESCTGTGSCPILRNQSCGVYACGATQCLGNCTSDTQCATGQFCSAGVCRAKHDKGNPCTAENECLSGQCVDGNCCDSACSGQCEACNISGSAGTCTPVSGDNPPGRVPCSPYICAAGTCTATCSSDSNCGPGEYCYFGTCKPQGQGNTGDWKARGSGGCSSSGGGPSLVAVLAGLACALLNRRRRKLARGAAAGLPILFFFAASAYAQDVSLSFSANRFQNSGGAFDILNAESARMEQNRPFELGFSLFANYANRPLRLVATADPGSQIILLKAQTTFDAGVTFGWLGRYEISAVLPFTAAEASGVAPNVSANLATPVSSTGLSDLRVTPKVLLLKGSSLQVAASVRMSFPTGKADSYLGYGSVTAAPTAIVEYGGPRGFRVAANAGVVFRQTRQFVDAYVGNAFAYGLGAELPLTADQRLVALATVVGEQEFRRTAAAEHPVELLGGLRWQPWRGLALTFAGGPGLSQGYGTPRYRLLGGLSFIPEGAPARSPQPLPNFSVPELSMNTELDKPSELDVLAAVNSSELGEILLLSSSAPTSGAVEIVDQRLLRYQPQQGFVGTDSFEYRTRNSRGQLASALVRVQVVGPPTPPPAPVVPKAEEPPVKAVLEADRISTLEPVRFETGRDVLLPESKPLLEEVASVLKAHPEILRVRVEGHTDNSGSLRTNMRLSAGRAKTVRQFLSQQGVEANRLEEASFGPNHPVAPNDTNEGRARNRRVDFVIIEPAS